MANITGEVLLDPTKEAYQKYYGNNYRNDYQSNYEEFIKSLELGIETGFKKGYSSLFEEMNKPKKKTSKEIELEGISDTLDQVNGGIRHFLNRKAVEAPLANVMGQVEPQREAKAILKENLVNRLSNGTKKAYDDMEVYRIKLKERAYRPQPRIYIEGQGCCAGLPSNAPDIVNAFRDYSLDTNRGRILPLEAGSRIVSDEGVFTGRHDFLQNPNTMAYNPTTYGTNAEQPPNFPGMGQGVIFGPKPAAPIGGPNYDTPIAHAPRTRPVYDHTYINHLPRGHRAGDEKLYATRDAYGDRFPTTLTVQQSSVIRAANMGRIPPHATRIRSSGGRYGR